MKKQSCSGSLFIVFFALSAGVIGGGVAGALVAYWMPHAPMTSGGLGTPDPQSLAYSLLRTSLPAATDSTPSSHLQPPGSPMSFPSTSPTYGSSVPTFPALREEVAVISAIRKVTSSVVTIVSQSLPFSGIAGSAQIEVTYGSGLVIDTSGLIVTNNHVVQRAQRLQVFLSDGSEKEGVVVGADSLADIAVVKIDGPIHAAVPLGDSDGLEVGQTVIKIGSPLNQFPGSATVGVISGLNRKVGEMRGLIQTDAVLNPGDSGGPLLSSSGNVIGISTMVVRTTTEGRLMEGLGFAIPINQVRDIVEQLTVKSNDYFPCLGIAFHEVEAKVGNVTNMTMVRGVVVTRLEPGSPAADSDLHERDIILEIDGTRIDQTHTALDILYAKLNETVTLTFLRDERQLQTELALPRCTN